ncbi:MAG TPA: hypothetical protein PLW86_08880 [Rhodocyclaceae bacterium]|nr:hypothetical protein [Rhodocyclaceae bacterium]
MRLNPLVKLALNALFIGAAIFFFARSLHLDADALARIAPLLSPTFLTALAILGVANLLTQHAAWQLITRQIGASIPYRWSLGIWSYSNVGKYVPGKIVPLVIRSRAYGRFNVGPLRVGYALFIDHFFSLLAAAVVATLAVAQLPTLSTHIGFPIMAVGAAGAGLVLWPRGANTVMARLAKLAGKKRPPALTRPYLLGCLAIHIAGLCWQGLGMVILAQVFGAGGLAELPFLIGALACASIVGMLSVFAPAGIGIKDLTLLALLTQMMPAPQAALIAVAARLWSSGTELLIGFAAYLAMLEASRPLPRNR